MNAPTDLEQALVLDPEFIQAAEALALVHAEMAVNSGVPSSVAWARARVAAEAALQIDPNSVRAHAVLGLARAEQEFQWQEADAELGKALRGNPRDTFALEFAARIAAHRGRYDEALRRNDAALSLDPLNSYLYYSKGTMQYLAGDMRGAEPSLRRAIELSPTFGGVRTILAWALMARGESGVALKEVMAEPAQPAKNSGLASFYHALGRKQSSDLALGRLMNDYGNWPFGVALAHAPRGERDQAVEWLERAHQAGDPDLLMFGVGHPFLAFLHDDPRYKAILRKMNLPE